MVGSNLPLTPQESEQLSVYVSDDNYVKKQKEDIEELSQMFREMLGNEGTDQGDKIKQFRNHFRPQKDFKATYKRLTIQMFLPGRPPKSLTIY